MQRGRARSCRLGAVFLLGAAGAAFAGGPPQISIMGGSVIEGDVGTASVVFVVSLDNAATFDVFVDFATSDGTATAGSDYVPAAGTLTFVAFEVTQTITVDVLGDTLFEGPESFTVTLSNPVNGTLNPVAFQANGDIVDDDPFPPPEVSIEDPIVNERDAGTTLVPLRVTAPGAALCDCTIDVAYTTRDGTAREVEDYVKASGTVTIDPATESAQISVEVVGDTVVELDERFFVDLLAATNATIVKGTGVVTVRNDDLPPEISIDDVSMAEGDGGTTLFTFTVELSPPAAQPVSVDYATADGSATVLGEDYRASSGTLTFGVGERAAEISVEVVGDLVFEGDETFTVALSNPMGGDLAKATGLGTIVNDDDLPGLSIDDVAAAEGDAGATELTFTVELSAATSQPVNVGYATADGSATVADGDYRATSGMVAFGPGTTRATLTVTVDGDGRPEPDETFFVQLSGAVGAVITDGEGEGLILNDDVELPSLSVGDTTVVEGDEGTVDAVFEVELSAAAEGPVTVGYATADGTARAADGDYRSVDGVLTFSPGQTAMTLVVPVLGDRLVEEDETFFVELMGADGGEVARGRGSGTIVDDDELSTIRIVAAGAVPEGSGPAAVRVERQGGAGGAAEVTVTTVDGSAVAGRDFAALTETVRWAAGEIGGRTVEIEILDDRLYEGDEELGVRLVDLGGDAVLSSPVSATIAIIDDDAPSGLVILEGGDRLSATVGSLLELRVQVVGEGGPVEGAEVRWVVEGDAQLLDGETVTSDPEGIAVQGLQLGSLPTRQLTVTALLPGTDVRVVFTIEVKGGLADLFSPEDEAHRVAEILDTACADASGELAETCAEVFGLDRADQVTLIESLLPRELAAAATIGREALLVQLRNLLDTLRSRRGGGSQQTVAGLSFNIRGKSLGVGRLLAALTDYRPPQEILAQRIDAALLDATGQGPAASQSAVDELDDLVEDEGSRLGFFLNGQVAIGERPDVAGETGYDFETSGLTAGLDYRLNERAFVGAALGYVDTDTDFARGRGRLAVSGYSVSLFSSFQLRSFYLDAVAIYGRNDYEQRRDVDLSPGNPGGLLASARSSPGGDQLGLHLGGGYDVAVGAGSLGGFGRLSYVDLSIDAFRESGGGVFDLAVAAQGVESLLAEAGLELVYPASFKWGVLQPQVRLSLFHELEDDSRAIDVGFIGVPDSDFSISTDPPDRDYLNLGLGLTFTLPRGRALYLLYDTDLERDDLSLDNFSFGFRTQL